MKLPNVPSPFVIDWPTRLVTGGLAVALLAAPLYGQQTDAQLQKEQAAAVKAAQEDLKRAEQDLKRTERERRQVEREARRAERNFAQTFDRNAVYFGVFPETVTENQATEAGLKKAEGVYLQNVVPNSPADKAGFKRGDIIVEINDQTVVNNEQFRGLVGKLEPNKSVKVEIVRDKKKQKLNVTPQKWAERSEMPALAYGFANPNSVWKIDQNEMKKQIEEAMKNAEIATAQAGTWNLFETRHGRLGVHTQKLSKQLAGFFNAPNGGVLVTEVVKDSAAEKAGLKAGDCITAINNQAVTNELELVQALQKAENATVTISLVRDKQPISVNATLEKPAAKTNFTWSGNWGRARLGVSTEKLTPQLSTSLGVSGDGVLVTNITENSAAQKAGLKAGDCITAVNGVAISSSSELLRELNKVQEGNVTLSIVRDKQPMTITATLEKRSELKAERLRLATPQITIPSIRFNGPRVRLPKIVELPQLTEANVALSELTEDIVLPLPGIPEFPSLEGLPELIEIPDLEEIDFAEIEIV
ncbi:MAG: PDZ domain-containing protein [Blastocatellia bacterium]|nr:PDZ domain-containing protein [Blastocatellia bacterium]